MVVDTGDGEGYVAKPVGIYIATDRLQQLFAGVPDVFIVDDGYACLRGEELRELMEACGALRYPRTEKAPHAPHWNHRMQALRLHEGHAQPSSYHDHVAKGQLNGFQKLLYQLP